VPASLAVVCSARPSWAKLQPVCEALATSGQAFELIACAYAVTHNRGGVVDMMRQDGYEPTVIHAAIDANTLETSALTTGLLLLRLTGHFATTKPSGVIVNHDRHETIAASIAASFQNILVFHLGGGEVSGNLDQRVRYANTALADVHFVSNEAAYRRVIDAGVQVGRVFVTGCPSIDVARVAQSADEVVTLEELDTYGTGATVDPARPFTILMHHPSTEHPEQAAQDWIDAYATAKQHAPHQPMVVFWPGADAGSDESSKVMRGANLADARLIRSLPPRRFLKLLSQCTLAVGNSSALIREGSYFGIPRIITGNRQQGRAWTRGPSHLYGDGYAAPRIAALCQRMVNV
jgi:UDP-hydrolysing UDP-N-acetyl-D-glucosamine 2-epimerase